MLGLEQQRPGSRARLSAVGHRSALPRRFSDARQHGLGEPQRDALALSEPSPIAKCVPSGHPAAVLELFGEWLPLIHGHAVLLAQ